MRTHKIYVKCSIQMVNQEKIINNLRQTCLDYSEKEINLKIDIEMLSSQLQRANNNQRPCVSSKIF